VPMVLLMLLVLIVLLVPLPLPLLDLVLLVLMVLLLLLLLLVLLVGAVGWAATCAGEGAPNVFEDDVARATAAAAVAKQAQKKLNGAVGLREEHARIYFIS
jgi:hypothetical protein